MINDTILVIGANGQIGTALLPLLQQTYGHDNVIGADLVVPSNGNAVFEQLDATDSKALAVLIDKYNVTQIYHLVAVLSAKAEQNYLWAWNLNMQTLLNVLELAREKNIKKLFIPSSIAAFGKGAPQDMTPQNAYLDPTSVYGISKVATENWSLYYHTRFGLDIRSLRYPGVISYQSMPGGGTTDYAVDIYHKAVQGQAYTCYLKEDTTLPMIYIDDTLRSTLELMEAPAENIRVRTSYNLAGVSFTPLEVYHSIRKHYPHFKCSFEPDFRQGIADSWPRTIDDSAARQDWGWKHRFDLEKITVDMIVKLTQKYNKA